MIPLDPTHGEVSKALPGKALSSLRPVPKITSMPSRPKQAFNRGAQAGARAAASPFGRGAKIAAVPTAAGVVGYNAGQNKPKPAPGAVAKGLTGDVAAKGLKAVKGLRAQPAKKAGAIRRSGQAAKQGYKAAGNKQAHVSSGSYVAGAAARKLRTPAALAGVGGTGYAVSEHKQNRIYKGATMHDESAIDMTVGLRPGTAEYISKWAGEKVKSEPSVGRLAAGAFAPGIHGAVAGKKGHKLRAAGNELGGSTVGGLVALPMAGAAVGTHRAHKMGHYKTQKKSTVKKADSDPFGIGEISKASDNFKAGIWNGDLVGPKAGGNGKYNAGERKIARKAMRRETLKGQVKGLAAGGAAGATVGALATRGARSGGAVVGGVVGGLGGQLAGDFTGRKKGIKRYQSEIGKSHTVSPFGIEH